MGYGRGMNPNSRNGFKKGHPDYCIEKVNSKQVKEFIRLYTKENKSTYEIGRIFGFGWFTILRHLKKNNVKIRTSGEARKGKPTWNKGIPMSEEHKRKMSLAKKGKSISSKGKPKPSIKGPNHYNWKGGAETYNEILRTSAKLKNWKKEVFKRDKYICQNPNCKFCNNEISGKLNAHHEIPFAECLKLGWEEMIYRVDNGTTYCENYHKIIHRGEII